MSRVSAVATAVATHALKEARLDYQIIKWRKDRPQPHLEHQAYTRFVFRVAALASLTFYTMPVLSQDVLREVFEFALKKIFGKDHTDQYYDYYANTMAVVFVIFCGLVVAPFMATLFFRGYCLLRTCGEFSRPEELPLHDKNANRILGGVRKILAAKAAEARMAVEEIERDGAAFTDKAEGTTALTKARERSARRASMQTDFNQMLTDDLPNMKLALNQVHYFLARSHNAAVSRGSRRAEEWMSALQQYLQHANMAPAFLMMVSFVARQSKRIEQYSACLARLDALEKRAARETALPIHDGLISVIMTVNHSVIGQKSRKHTQDAPRKDHVIRTKVALSKIRRGLEDDLSAPVETVLAEMEKVKQHILSLRAPLVAKLDAIPVLSGRLYEILYDVANADMEASIEVAANDIGRQIVVMVNPESRMEGVGVTAGGDFQSRADALIPVATDMFSLSLKAAVAANLAQYRQRRQTRPHLVGTPGGHGSIDGSGHREDDPLLGVGNRLSAGSQ